MKYINYLSLTSLSLAPPNLYLWSTRQSIYPLVFNLESTSQSIYPLVFNLESTSQSIYPYLVFNLESISQSVYPLAFNIFRQCRQCVHTWHAVKDMQLMLPGKLVLPSAPKEELCQFICLNCHSIVTVHRPN